MKQVQWHPWQDCLRKLVYSKEQLEGEQLAPFDEDEMDAISSFSMETISRNSDVNTGPVIVHNEIGIVPLFESNLPSKMYNFWMGHTNFRITEAHYAKIIKTNGVESIKIYSPYRFRIAIGHMFNPKKVRNRITKRLCEEEEYTPQVAAKTSQIDISDKLMTRQYPFWARLIFSDGSREYVTGYSIEEVEAKLDDFISKCTTDIEDVARNYGGVRDYEPGF